MTTLRNAVRALALLGSTILLASAAPAEKAASSPATRVTEVRVERVKPQREKHPTLRFLRANKDFIRARYDRVREKPLEQRARGDAIDPRYLAWRELLAEVNAARDSASRVADTRSRDALMQSVTELGALETELDLVERLLAGQRERLAALERDFAGDPRTELLVVVSGYPGEAALSEVAIQLEDGATIALALTPEQREALGRGGVVEIFHGSIEPREQVIAVTIRGDRWPEPDTGFMTLDPARDRLTLLRLDLSSIRPAQGALGIHASTWLHDAGTTNNDG